MYEKRTQASPKGKVKITAAAAPERLKTYPLMGAAVWKVTLTTHLLEYLISQNLSFI